MDIQAYEDFLRLIDSMETEKMLFLYKDNYKGKLFEKIGVGTTEEEMLKIEPSFVYDDFEEVWESDKGVFIEMDAETNKARWISVYKPELDLENFEDCQW